MTKLSHLLLGKLLIMFLCHPHMQFTIKISYTKREGISSISEKLTLTLSEFLYTSISINIVIFNFHPLNNVRYILMSPRYTNREPFKIYFEQFEIISRSKKLKTKFKKTLKKKNIPLHHKHKHNLPFKFFLMEIVKLSIRHT